MDTENTDANTNEEEKKMIEVEQRKHAQDIVEPDEAAASAEGMDNREDNILSEDVAEDRDAIPPQAEDLPEQHVGR